MKRLLTIVVLFGAMAGGVGCGTPAYTPAERSRLIARTWNYDGAQAIDDFDSVLLLRPPSRMTIWNVR